MSHYFPQFPLYVLLSLIFVFIDILYISKKELRFYRYVKDIQKDCTFTHANSRSQHKRRMW